MPGPKKEHQEIACKWAEIHGGSIKGFSKALVKTFGDDELEGYRPEFIPDAWKFHDHGDGSPPSVILLEVQTTNPISEAKMSKIVNLWHTLDSIGSSLTLLVVDRTLQFREVDVLGHYYSFLRDGLESSFENKKHYTLKWRESK